MKTREVKEIYNRQVSEKFSGDYEHARWFSSPVKKAGYEMTKKTIFRRLLDKGTQIFSYLELGPGAGTWTKIFYENNPGAYFFLIDISSEMLKLARKKLPEGDNVKYWEGDFLDFKAGERFDFFFSCRAFEYLPDKELAAAKINELLKPGGTGFIITKTPKYLRSRLLGRKVGKLHAGQIAPGKLKNIFEKAGFTDIEIYPTTMVFPFLGIAALDKFLFFIFSPFKLNILSQFFSESYCVKFRKAES
jgi:ubiquinone/menaquinone biosynthesis C-methylase UbiE